MTALYLDVKKDLLDKITSGEYPEGTIIPTEHELSNMYCVSRPTIRKAVQILVDAGYLEKKKKRGTIVCTPKVIQDFTQTISSFDTLMKRHGVVSQTQVIAFKKEQASKEIADSLHLQEDDLVYKLVRLRYTDKNPNVFITTYIPVSIFPDLLDTDFTHVRLYDVFEAQGHGIDTIDRQLEMIKADDTIADMLDIEEGEPLFYFHSVGYDTNKNPIEYSIARYRSDINTFTLHLNRHKGE